MTRTSSFDFGSRPNPDPAYQWDTKRKLFSLADVCAPPYAVIVHFCVFHPEVPSPIVSCVINFFKFFKTTCLLRLPMPHNSLGIFLEHFPRPF